ncbi:MAG: DUF1186 domain-containing protein, partial [Flavobacteriaceae bacterium]|nr:DUF1186 domain-containing protein [Flavobacteriaceae bacterium]
LYENGYDIKFEKINAILALDRELLISDLIGVLNDSIVRFEFFSKKAETEGHNDENFNFPSHALLLLIELKAEVAIDQILEILKQDQDFYDFWFGDLLQNFALPAIFWCGLNQTGKLLNFLKQPNTHLYSKCFVGEAVIRIPAIFPERRPEILSWSRELLNSNIENSNDIAPDDILYNGFLIADLTDAGFHELLPEIKQLFDSQSIAVHICGDYEEIVEDISIQDYQYFDQLENSIFENYSFLNEEFEDIEIENEKDFDKGLFNDSRFLNELPESDLKLPKIGRNEPCPCGSGKKYKKCCIDSN